MPFSSRQIRWYANKRRNARRDGCLERIGGARGDGLRVILLGQVSVQGRSVDEVKLEWCGGGRLGGAFALSLERRARLK